MRLPVDDVESFADQMLGEYGLILATASNYAGAEGSFIRVPTGYPADETRRAMRILRMGIEQFTKEHVNERHDEEYSPG